ncbi:unnamed protein product, partial [marine sediment metagenome]
KQQKSVRWQQQAADIKVKMTELNLRRRTLTVESSFFASL